MVVQNNILYNAAWDNFHFNGKCDSCTLSGNIMYSANMGAGGGAGNATFQEGWNHGLIQNNIIFNSSAYGLIFDDYHDGQPDIVAYDQSYNVIRNNTFVHTGRDASGQDLSSNGFTVAAVINEDSSTHDMGHNTWDNNIFVEMAAGGSGNAIMRYQMLSGDANWLSTDTWRNNILYANNGAAPLSWGVGSVPPQQTWSYFSSHAGTFTNNSQAKPDAQCRQRELVQFAVKLGFPHSVRQSC